MFKLSRNDPHAIVTIKIRGTGEQGWVRYYEWVRPSIQLVHFHPDAPRPIEVLNRDNLVALQVLPF